MLDDYSSRSRRLAGRLWRGRGCCLRRLPRVLGGAENGGPIDKLGACALPETAAEQIRNSTAKEPALHKAKYIPKFRPIIRNGDLFRVIPNGDCLFKSATRITFTGK